MRYELIRLDKLTKVYIPIFSTLPEEEMLQLAEEKFLEWERKVIVETENIKSSWLTAANKCWSKEELQQYINCREEGLLSLITWTGTMLPAFRKVLYSHLEDLILSFVRIFPVRHSYLNRQIPLHVLSGFQQECSILYQQCRAGLKSQRIPAVLIDAILFPLRKMAFPESDNWGIGFDRLRFILRLQTALGEQLQLSYNHPDPQGALIRSLCSIDFNSPVVSQRIEEYIKKKLRELDEVFAEKRLLDNLLADLSTIISLPDSVYEYGTRALCCILKEKIALLAAERQEVISSLTQGEMTTAADGPTEQSIIKLAMTLEEFGLFLRLKAAASGILIRKKTLRLTFQIMAQFMRTKDKGMFAPFSAHSLAQKFYIVSDSAIKSTGDLLKRMMRNLKEIEKCKRQGLPLPKIRYS